MMILVIVIILLMYLLFCEINNKNKLIEENTFEFIHPASF
jgi:hypothetical protein